MLELVGWTSFATVDNRITESKRTEVKEEYTSMPKFRGIYLCVNEIFT